MRKEVDSVVTMGIFHLIILRESQVMVCSKVPKREIFDRSDFPDFYTIKSLRVGDFKFKI
jgi:hypothetical protein